MGNLALDSRNINEEIMPEKLSLEFLLYGLHSRIIVNAIMLCTPGFSRIEFAGHMFRRKGHYSETLWMGILQ
jgi:hypothetical protein